MQSCDGRNLSRHCLHVRRKLTDGPCLIHLAHLTCVTDGALCADVYAITSAAGRLVEMKIVLRQDVPNLGESGSVHNVAKGYARNYLIPQGMAVAATKGELKTAEHNAAVKERKILRQEEQLRSYSDKIQGQRLTFTARAGEQGRLYGSITAAEIATKLSEQTGEEIDRRRVTLDDPLRTLGEHTVSVHVVGRLRPEITVIVEAEQTEEEASDTSEAAEATTDEEAETSDT